MTLERKKKLLQSKVKERNKCNCRNLFFFVFFLILFKLEKGHSVGKLRLSLSLSDQPALICTSEPLGDCHPLRGEMHLELCAVQGLVKLQRAERLSCCRHFSVMLHEPLFTLLFLHGRLFERDQAI